MNTIKVSDIIVPKVLKESQPKDYKLSRIRNFVLKHGRLDKPIVINYDKVLTDNYIRYLVAVEQGLGEVPFMYAQEYREKVKFAPKEYPTITYVVGKFYRYDKEYVWKNDKNLNIEIGDKVLVVSKDKYRKKINRAVVTVVDIFKSNNPAYLKHRSVIKVIHND